MKLEKDGGWAIALLSGMKKARAEFMHSNGFEIGGDVSFDVLPCRQ